MKKIIITLMILLSTKTTFGQCEGGYTYYSDLPLNVTILIGDSCLSNNDIAVMDSIIMINQLEYNSPLELGTQTWFNGRLRFMVVGNYGNSVGVNDTIYSLPDNIGNWDQLATLYLEWNRITILPESFSNMISLQSFYINNNILESLPNNIGDLENLYFLDLGYNKIGDIPESICNLTNLSYLWLFNNNIESLPDCFCDLNLEWNNDDNGGYPYFAIGANMLCANIDSCVAQSENFELSLDQFYYSFPVYSPQECDDASTLQNQFSYQYQLSQPYPNPFNPSTTLQLNIPYDRKVKISIYNLLGNEIEVLINNEIFKAGKHNIHWSGSDTPSGIYFIKINDGLNIQTRKLILMK